MGIEKAYKRIEEARNEKKKELGTYCSDYYDYYTEKDVLEGAVDAFNSAMAIIEEECPEVLKEENKNE